MLYKHVVEGFTKIYIFMKITFVCIGYNRGDRNVIPQEVCGYMFRMCPHS